MDVTAEIIAVGNELLAGDVLDTNSHWLCGKLTGLGATIIQVTQVRDDLRAIEVAVRAACGRGSRLVLTTGGLGPTEDDRTLEGVAAALGLSLAPHPLARAWVQATYAALARSGHVGSSEMSPAREKMALLPEGAEPLRNGAGAAPGVLLRRGASAIVCLPGVPAELKDIFEGSLRPFLAQFLGSSCYEQWTVVVACGDESVLAPVLREASSAHPDVYIKSRAGRLGQDVRFTVTLSARGPDGAEVDAALRSAWHDLGEGLARAQIRVLSENRGR